MDHGTIKDNAIQEKIRIIEDNNHHIQDLSNKLKSTLDEGVRQDSVIMEQTKAIAKINNIITEKENAIISEQQRAQELSQKLDSVNLELQRNREEIAKISDTLKEKDLHIEGKNQHIGKLSESLDSMRNELFARKEEISGLSEKLKASLEEALRKDAVNKEQSSAIAEINNIIKEKDKSKSAISFCTIYR